MEKLNAEMLVELYRRNDKHQFCMILKVFYNIKNDIAEFIYQSFLLMDCERKPEVK